MDGLTSQRSHHFGNVVLLKEPDGGNASRTSVQADVSVLDRDATQRKHRDFLSASFAKSVQAEGTGLRGTFLFKDGREHGIVCPLRRSTRDVGSGMARDADHAGGMSCLHPNRPRF